MKVAIITCSGAQSYGAVLQTYATQKFVEKLGHTAEIINYSPEYVVKSHKVLYIGDDTYKRNIFVRIAYLLYTGPSRFKRKRMFHKFLNRFIHFGKKVFVTNEELNNCTPVADVYICGSDQIWNINFPNGTDPAYYLGFVKGKPKYSYAASMALQKDAIPFSFYKFLSERLADFSGISVREDIAVDIIQPYVKQKIEHVLDPVFLLDVEDWDKLESSAESTLKNEGYILMMPMGDGLNVHKTAIKYKEKMGLPLYNITFSQKRVAGVDKCFNACSPQMFLRLIKNAKLVVTNSFHGTAFSIIYNRNFICCQIPGTSSRIESLLRSFSMEDHMIQNDDIRSVNYMKMGENYNQFELTKKSRTYLSDICRNSY